MNKIAFVGMGAMGARMAARLVSDFEVFTWSRSGKSVDGARAVDTLRELVAESELVISCVRDDDAARAVWRELFSAPGRAQLFIESSTLGIDCVKALHDQSPVAFLEAPVVGSRPQAEAGELVHLVGGGGADLDRARPVLDKLGRAQKHIGGPGAGMAMKLVVNALFATQVSALAELFQVTRAEALDDATVLAALEGTPVLSPILKALGGQMLSGAFAPLFPVELVEKDLGYACHAAQQAPTIAGARAAFGLARERGLGGEHLAAIYKAFKRNE